MRKSIVIAAGAAFAVVSATMLSCSGGQDKYLASLKNVGTVSLNAVEEYHYDWDGNPLRHYVLDKEVERIAIKGDVLFGLSTYPEYRIYKFQ